MLKRVMLFKWHSSFARRYINTISNNETHSQNKLCKTMAQFRTESAEDGFVWTSRYGHITIPHTTVDQYVWKNIAKWEKKTALVCGVSGRSYTYGKLRDHCAAVAYRLRNNFNLKPGDVVAIAMSNCPEYAIVALGAIEAGLTVTTMNPNFTVEEQARQLSLADAKLVVCLVDNCAVVLASCVKNKTTIPVVTLKTNKKQIIPDGVIDFDSIMQTESFDFSQYIRKPQSPNQVCLLPFSSGTSGLPKGVMLTHANIVSNVEISEVPNPHSSITAPTTEHFQEVFPCVVPFYHIYGIAYSLIAKLSLGCKLVTLPKFDPATYISTIAEHKATFLSVVPPIFHFLTNNDRCSTKDLKYVRSLMCAGAPIGADAIERFRNTKGGEITCFLGLGMTEISPVAFLSHRLYPNYASIGWPVASTEVKIVNIDDPLNRGLGANVSGELMVRSPSVMLGYLKNPTETKKVLSDDGWLRTGDIGSYDNNGDFYITDRAKELIKVHAFQVAPAELEECLRSHPKVVDVGVIGVQHAKFGEAPKAFVVRRDRSLTSSEVQKYIEERCIKYKWLVGGVQFIDEVPRNPSGKILRRELKRMYVL